MTSEPTQTTTSTLKVLLVADEEFRGSEFLDELRQHIDGRSAEVQVFVIAPALASSGLEHELAAFDGAIKEAGERLENILAELKTVGIDAIGQVGDGDVVLAIGDGLREFEAEEIIVVGHADKDAAYGEKNLWKRIEHEFHQPVVELVVGDATSGSKPGLVETRRDPGRAETEEERIERTRNVPPFTRRDLFGILVGFIGTVALGLIAVGAGTAGADDNGGISGGAAVVLLLAIGAFLLNAAHIVGLLFFESVRYTGVWEKFMARLAMLYTIPAVIISLIIWATL
ncbi:MAG: hypothetical protein WBP55_03415 [Solirubrobacterales bacterium]